MINYCVKIPLEWSHIVRPAGSGLCLNQASSMEITYIQFSSFSVINLFPKFRSSFYTRKSPYLACHFLRILFVSLVVYTLLSGWVIGSLELTIFEASEIVLVPTMTRFSFLLLCHLLILRLGWLYWWWGVWKENQLVASPSPCCFHMDCPAMIIYYILLSICCLEWTVSLIGKSQPAEKSFWRCKHQTKKSRAWKICTAVDDSVVFAVVGWRGVVGGRGEGGVHRSTWLSGKRYPFDW